MDPGTNQSVQINTSSHPIALGTSMDPTNSENVQVDFSSHSIVPRTSMDPANSENMQTDILCPSTVPGTSMDPGDSRIVQANISSHSIMPGSSMDPADDIDEQLAQVSLYCIQKGEINLFEFSSPILLGLLLFVCICEDYCVSYLHLKIYLHLVKGIDCLIFHSLLQSMKIVNDLQ